MAGASRGSCPGSGTPCNAACMNARMGWEDEATTRAMNAQPWEPPPGMVKRQCPDCRYWFAAPVHRALEPRCGLRGEAAAWAPAVTRAELIAELAASSPHLRQEDAELIVATIFDQITAALARGERVELRGFGAFTVKQRNARIGRNPRTGKVVAVDEKAVPYFKTGREMLRRLNGGGGPASA